MSRQNSSLTCPLRILENLEAIGCNQEECAWWNQDDSCCIIVYAANTLADIWIDIRSINEGWRYVVCELGELIRNEKHRRGIEDDSSCIL
jgi:hypothetical protein